MNHVFLEISLIMGLAAAVAAVMQLLRQPLIVGHILTGLVLGPAFLNVIKSGETLELLSSLGVALLLFIIGLSLNPGVVKEVGKVSLVTGLGQVVFTSLIGYGISLLLGFSPLAAIYIAIALTFSSTIIILKLLSDKRDLGRLYGKIATGFLLVQDIVATLILILVTAGSRQGSLQEVLTSTGWRIAALLLGFIVLTRFILPRLSSFFGRSQEFLFLFSLAWGLGLAAMFSVAGLSIEIGALFAGVALATSPYSYEITARMKPLRDFFIVLFFILLGSSMTVAGLSLVVWPALVLSAFILIGNPLIVMVLMGLLGYTKKTGFKAGLTVAQISEFSLILVVLGNRVGHLSAEVVSMVTLVGIVTIAISSYMIIYSDGIYRVFEPYLGWFERKRAKRERDKTEKYDVVLFGYKRAGFQFVESFGKLGRKFIVVDFDPEIISRLERDGINCMYGDANSSELLAALQLESTVAVISTITDYSANSLILHTVRSGNKDAIVVLNSDSIEEASRLYANDATYVMMPHYLGSQQTSRLVEKHGFDLSTFIKERERHQEYLKHRLELT